MNLTHSSEQSFIDIKLSQSIGMEGAACLTDLSFIHASTLNVKIKRG